MVPSDCTMLPRMGVFVKSGEAQNTLSARTGYSAKEDKSLGSSAVTLFSSSALFILRQRGGGE